MSLWCDQTGATCAECQVFDFIPSVCATCHRSFCWEHRTAHHATGTGTEEWCPALPASTPHEEEPAVSSRPLLVTGRFAGLNSANGDEEEAGATTAASHNGLPAYRKPIASQRPSFFSAAEGTRATAVLPGPIILKAANHVTSSMVSIPVLLTVCSGPNRKGPMESYTTVLTSWSVATYLSAGRAAEMCLETVWSDAESLHAALMLCDCTDDDVGRWNDKEKMSSNGAQVPPLVLSSVPNDSLILQAFPRGERILAALVVWPRDAGSDVDMERVKVGITATLSAPLPLPGTAAYSVEGARLRSIRTWLTYQYRSKARRREEQVKVTEKGGNTTTEDNPSAEVEGQVADPADPEEPLSAGFTAEDWPFRLPPPLYTRTFLPTRHQPLLCDGLPPSTTSRATVAVFLSDLSPIPREVQPFCAVVSTEWANGKAVQLLKELAIEKVLRCSTQSDAARCVLRSFHGFLLPRLERTRKPDKEKTEQEGGPFVLCLSSDEMKNARTVLRSGDSIFLGPPLAGGAPAAPAQLEQEMARLSSCSASEAKLLQRNVMMKCSVM